MEIILPIVYSALFGITIKVADLLDEHGLKLFKGDRIIFGLLWGIFGSLLMLKTNPVIASAFLAMILGCLVRNRLDYLNHQIGAALMFLTGFGLVLVNFTTLIIFFLLFVTFGSVKDYTDDVLHIKKGALKIFELMPYYPVISLVYCLISGNWLLFWTLTVFTILYNITKIIGKNRGYK